MRVRLRREPPLALLVVLLLDAAHVSALLAPLASSMPQLCRPLAAASRARPCVAAAGNKKPAFSRSVASNKLARRNYEILAEYEAGVSLTGTEVKSCRDGKLNLRDGFCRVKDGQCWLENVNIAQHATTGRYFQHEETRPRRLLLHKREILKLGSECDQKGLTIVPLNAYFNEENRLKVLIGLAKGKNLQDKRETIQRRQLDRENQRMMKDFR